MGLATNSIDTLPFLGYSDPNYEKNTTDMLFIARYYPGL